MANAAKLIEGSVAGHLFGQTWPALFGVAALVSVGIVDAYFVGSLGPDALAAVSFIFPVTTALSSLGVGVIVGINSVVSRVVGRGDMALAEARGLQGVGLAVVLGLMIGAALNLGAPALFRLMNADAELLPLLDAYMTPYSLGFPVLLVNMGLNGILRGQAAAVRSSVLLIVVAVANWVLDPLLIVGFGPVPGFGIAGAAYATIGSLALAAIAAFVLVQTGALPLRLSRLTHGGFEKGVRDVMGVGLPAAITNAINPIGLAIITALLATHGAQQVAGFGAAGRVQAFACVPLLALSSSIGPIVGQNWGARQFERARRGLGLACGFSMAYGLVAAATLVLLRGSVAGVFTDDPVVADAAETYLLIASWGYALFGILIVTNGALNAMGRATLALRISTARVLLVMVPVALIGSTYFGAHGVFASELAANLVAGPAALWLGLRVLASGERGPSSLAPAPTSPPR